MPRLHQIIEVKHYVEPIYKRNKLIKDGLWVEQVETFVPYTAEEEKARDAEEAVAITEQTARDAQESEIDGLDAKVVDGSILYPEMVRLMQLRSG